MKTKTLGLGAVLLVIGAAACAAPEADANEATVDPAEFVRVINVEVAPVTTETFVEDIRLTSVAMANQDVIVSAEESGVIRELYADRGDVVTRGARLAKIDDALLQAQVDQARAAAELAQQTWERRKRLWEEDQIGSELAYLEAKFTAEQAAATLTALEERLDRTIVRAPFDGIFEERHVEIGTMVNPGESIGRIVDLDPIKVFAGVPERYATDIAMGGQAAMTFEALGGEDVFRAPIRYVGATVNPSNRTFPIEVEVPNRQGAIKPQMVANMSVTRREVTDAVVVPQDALVRVEDGYVVFVVAREGGEMVAEARPVELGPTRRNLVVLEAGVAVGEELIVVGHKSVANGDRVNVVGRNGQ